MVKALIRSAALALALGGGAHAQQFDIDMRGTDLLSQQGSSASTQVQVTRSAPSLGSGPQLDLSGGLGDTLGSSGSCSTCTYGGTNTAVDNLRNTDSLR